MLSRRLMTQQHGEAPIDWDIEWKYTDGPPENFGWGVRTTHESSVQMADDGYHMKCESDGDNREFCSITSRVPAAIVALTCELQLSVLKMAINPAVGVRWINTTKARSSDAQSGTGLYIRDGKALLTRDPARSILLDNIETQKTYKILMITNGLDKNLKVYINGVKKYDGKIIPDGQWCQGTPRVIQQGDGEMVIKSVRYKYTER